MQAPRRGKAASSNGFAGATRRPGLGESCRGARQAGGHRGTWKGVQVERRAAHVGEPAILAGFAGSGPWAAQRAREPRELRDEVVLGHQPHAGGPRGGC